MDKTHIINKYKDFIFEIQMSNSYFSIYNLKDIEFIPSDDDYLHDQIYLVFDPISNDETETVFEINLGVDVLAVSEMGVTHLLKTIRVESTESFFEFSENSCNLLKDLISSLVTDNQSEVNDNTKESIKILEPYYFNNIRFF